MTEAIPTDSTIQRSAAIDVLRALVMLLMIFVNDLWSLKGVPAWLEHVSPGVDGMGLADTVFPAFLFIVGLSLPFAIDARRAKGDSDLRLLFHVAVRGIALLVMGVFLVNGETINREATPFVHGLWEPLACAAFILVWNAWPRTLAPWLSYALRGTGLLILLILAIIYRGGEGGPIQYFAPQWWGILGLIGWSYLAAGIIAVLAHGRLVVLIAAWVFFAVLSVAWHAELLPQALDVLPETIIRGTLTGLVMGGAVIGRLFQIYRQKSDDRTMTLVFAAIAIALLLAAQLTRPLWGLSKLDATPAWLFLCSALTLIGFTAIYWLVDVAGKSGWFRLIRPGGTDTLLCYLMPSFLYALIYGLGLIPPDAFLTGIPGLIKSALFALLCIVLAGQLSRFGVCLKL